MVRNRSVTARVGNGLRILCPVAIFALCIWSLLPHIAAQSFDSMFGQMRAIPWQAWLGAVAMTIISLWSVGRYDGVAHRHFATGVADVQARWTGTIAISLAQTLGFGLFTGALVRWRMLPDVNLSTAFRLSTFVSLSFLVSWVLVLGVVCAVMPAPVWIKPLAFTIVAVIPVAIWLLFRHPVLRIRRCTVRLPSLLNAGAIVVWTAVDTCAAAAVLFVMLPADAGLSFAEFLPLFLVALGASLLSSTPGGVGPFELLMIGLLTHLPAGEILVSILAYRMIYYAVPAVLALGAIALPFPADVQPTQARKINLKSACNAELGLIYQNGGHTLASGNGACAVWPTGQTLTLLFDPVHGSAAASISMVSNAAHYSGKIATIYKCNGKTAMAAQRLGWSVMHICDDAVVDPLTYAPRAPSARRLRRKLRSAEKSGLVIDDAGHMPWSEMARVDTAWQNTHGTARGGTMGRFEQGYLSDHLIICGYHKGTLVAFVSFQRSAKEWCLDLMRHSPDAPDGTMHALVHQAIMCAKDAAISRVNLTAVPACPDPDNAFFRWAAQIAVTKAGGTGLRQFKSAFSPRWSPRYAAAPNPVALGIALADIAREIHSPAPIVAAPLMLTRKIHNNNENYALAS